MDTSLLTASTSTGTQASTQNPQIAGRSTASGTQSSKVQPGTTRALLDSQGGVPLQSTSLTMVNLNAPAAKTAMTTAVNPMPAKHQINPTLAGLTVVLFVIAIVSFWIINRSAKNTT
ncbi:MAG: hypothetical protein AAB971_02770 [Patescibacteria group bacterium]